MTNLSKYCELNQHFTMQELLFTRSNDQTVAYYDYRLGEDVVFWHHGVGAAGPISTIVGENADANGFRIIEIARSGYGNSTSNSNRAVEDLGNIDLELADFLGIEKFCLVGASGGGPHALAAARNVGNRCIGTLLNQI